MEEINKILNFTEENRKLLRLISEKQDAFFKRLDELEGKLCSMKDKNDNVTFPESDTETFKVETPAKVTKEMKTMSFSDSEDDNEGGEVFKDAIQMPPVFELKEDDMEFKLDIKVDEEKYYGSIYYSYSKSKCKRISSIKCTFKKNVTNEILEITSNDDEGSNVNLQVVCGAKDKGMYDMEVKDKYVIIKIRPEALINSKLDVRLVLLKFSNKDDASKIFNKLCK